MTRALAKDSEAFDFKNRKSSGFLIYTLRTTFRDLTVVYGSEGARQIADEIISEETGRRRM